MQYGVSLSLQVHELRKDYRGFTAVHNLSFSVEPGSLFAFLGSNGAGKSTTIGCITTALTPTSGTIVVAGHNTATEAVKVRRAIGAVFQSSLLDPLLTIRENLESRARLYGIDRRTIRRRTKKLSTLVGLESILDRRYGPLSGGQKRRADIARALIHSPSVLFLDEPTAGLDPQSRQHIWDTIEELRRNQGMTVFLTTHYMEETERADRVCVIDRGRIVADGTPVDLRARHSSSVLTITSHDSHDRDGLRAACVQRGIAFADRGDRIELRVESSSHARELLGQLEPDDFEFRHGTMDDVFLAVTGAGRLEGVAA